MNAPFAISETAAAGEALVERLIAEAVLEIVAAREAGWPDAWRFILADAPTWGKQ